MTPSPSATGSLFDAMLQEFEEAARILNLDRGIWRILTNPKRQITVSCPVQMDNGEIIVFSTTSRWVPQRAASGITRGSTWTKSPRSPRG